MRKTRAIASSDGSSARAPSRTIAVTIGILLIATAATAATSSRPIQR